MRQRACVCVYACACAYARMRQRVGSAGHLQAPLTHARYTHAHILPPTRSRSHSNAPFLPQSRLPPTRHPPPDQPHSTNPPPSQASPSLQALDTSNFDEEFTAQDPNGPDPPQASSGVAANAANAANAAAVERLRNGATAQQPPPQPPPQPAAQHRPPSRMMDEERAAAFAEWGFARSTEQPEGARNEPREAPLVYTGT